MLLKASRGSNLLVDYAQQEVAKKERIIVENSDWLGLVPYWATWPYETMILPRNKHILRCVRFQRLGLLSDFLSRMTDLTEAERLSLADIMKQLTTKYDNLFECSFPYSMVTQERPFPPSCKSLSGLPWSSNWTRAPERGLFSLAIPCPLLSTSSKVWLYIWSRCLLYNLFRSATVKKFMVGYEMLANPQRDLTAEQVGWSFGHFVAWVL